MRQRQNTGKLRTLSVVEQPPEKPECVLIEDNNLKGPEVLSRWAQYFDQLLNDHFNEQLEAPLADSVMLPSIDETQKAMRRLKNDKEPEPTESQLHD